MGGRHRRNWHRRNYQFLSHRASLGGRARSRWSVLPTWRAIGKQVGDPLDKPALVAEARTAIEFTFPAAIGKVYRIEASTDLDNWEIVESGIAGNGAVIQRFYSTRGMPKRYFRVEEQAP